MSRSLSHHNWLPGKRVQQSGLPFGPLFPCCHLISLPKLCLLKTLLFISLRITSYLQLLRLKSPGMSTRGCWCHRWSQFAKPIARVYLKTHGEWGKHPAKTHIRPVSCMSNDSSSQGPLMGPSHSLWTSWDLVSCSSVSRPEAAT